MSSYLILSCCVVYCCSLDEIINKESAFKLREKLLEQEKELLKTRADWITQELEDKTVKITGLKKEWRSTLSQAESKVAIREEKVKYV